ncbi:MAG: thymidylate synthase [Erysipelotrichaceae bacterium]|jgi:thymidylate synthase|nr:thymidylate synthase [Erysipelotrichaceae bacterium]
MSNFDKQYLKLCETILKKGVRTKNRTGTDTIKIPFATFHFDVRKEFPILNSKYVAWKAAILEILWIYQVASNDVRWLQERNIKIWNEWMIDEKGYYQGKYFGQDLAYTIGTAYGAIVQKYQLTKRLIDNIKQDSSNRRLVMSLWQESELATGVLPPCVFLTMWDITDGKLNLIVTQRSCDVALGLPFNVTQYATLLSLIAHVTKLKVGTLEWVIKDAHLYVNQIDGIKEQIARYQTMDIKEKAKLVINKRVTDFFKFDNSIDCRDIQVANYINLGKIKMPVSV